jgi:hypothetical protein
LRLSIDDHVRVTPTYVEHLRLLAKSAGRAADGCGTPLEVRLVLERERLITAAR